MSTVMDKPPVSMCEPNQVGFFTWELATDLLHGDEVLAELFDIAHMDLKNGIPIERVLTRIDKDDRPRVAMAIHSAIITGRPYKETYRVVHDSGKFVQIIAMGRCFQYADGTPSHYAGSVVEAANDPLPIQDLLRVHCLTALSLAKKAGNPLAERYIASAIRVIGPDHT